MIVNVIVNVIVIVIVMLYYVCMRIYIYNYIHCIIYTYIYTCILRYFKLLYYIYISNDYIASGMPPYLGCPNRCSPSLPLAGTTNASCMGRHSGAETSGNSASAWCLSNL